MENGVGGKAVVDGPKFPGENCINYTIDTHNGSIINNNNNNNSFI